MPLTEYEKMVAKDFLTSHRNLISDFPEEVAIEKIADCLKAGSCPLWHGFQCTDFESMLIDAKIKSCGFCVHSDFRVLSTCNLDKARIHDFRMSVARFQMNGVRF